MPDRPLKAGQDPPNLLQARIRLAANCLSVSCQLAFNFLPERCQIASDCLPTRCQNSGTNKDRMLDV